MQDPLDIATYSELDLNEFRVKWTPKLVQAIQERIAKELGMAPIWEQQQLQRRQRREEEGEMYMQEFQRALREFRENQREVEEWLESRSQAQKQNDEHR